MAYAPFLAAQTTSTTGTGTLTLIAASANARGFQTAYGNSSVVIAYMLRNSTQYELGVGTYDGGSPGSLTRSVILASSNSGSAISLGAGTHDVYGVHTPGQWGYLTATGDETRGAGSLVGVEYVWTGGSDGTLTLGNVSAFPEGLGFRVRNAGTAVLTIDPNSTETVNGATLLICSPGDWVEFKKRGSNWDAFGSIVRRTTYTSSGTWRKNATSRVVRVRSWAGGGGGGAGVVVAAATACSGGAGGGGGAYVDAWFSASELSATETVTIGAGGTAGTTSGQAGGVGGTTQLGGWLGTRVFGGGGGQGGASGANSGGGGGGMIFGAGATGSGGTGGSAASGAGSSGGSGAGSIGNAGVGNGTGGAGGLSASVGLMPGQPANGGQGGASGGGLNGSNTPYDGGTVGWGSANHSAGGTASGGAATAATAREAGMVVSFGGGGGGAHTAGTGGAGAAGQTGGGGGGGGGSAQTTQGAGGVGGGGMMIIMEW
jgi:hypothetical protein